MIIIMNVLIIVVTGASEGIGRGYALEVRVKEDEEEKLFPLHS